MAQENIEIVRRSFDALNLRDFAVLIDLTDPDAVWWDRRDDPMGGAPYCGRDACMQHIAEILEDVDLRAEPEEFIDAGDTVVVGVRLVGRGRASGVAFDDREFHVITLRDGKLAERREYRDRTEALEAVGLSE